MMFDALRHRVAERRLTSDARAGRWSRNRARSIQYAYVRKNWTYLAGGAGLGGLATAAIAIAAPGTFLTGAAVGAGIVATLGGLMFGVVLFTGTANQIMGATGESWTSSELRPLLKHGWRLIDHVYYRYGDVDHLLIGPAGVIVVETKWRSELPPLNAPDDRTLFDVGHLEQRAHDVQLTIPQLRYQEGVVRTAMFLWGNGGVDNTPTVRPIKVNGVDIVRGVTAARAWRQNIVALPPVLDAEGIDDVWRRISEDASKTDRRELDQPAPPSLTRMYWTLVASILAAGSALLAGLYTTKATNSVGVGYAFAAIALTAGVVARRQRSLRYAALGWSVGCAAVAALLLALQFAG